MEYEIIQHSQIRGLKILMDDVNYRTPHMHREFELVLVLSGTLLLTSLGEESEIPAGEIAVLNPWQTHELRGKDGTMTGLFVQILPDVFRNYFPAAARLRFQRITSGLSSHDLASLREIMVNLGKHYFAMQPFYEFVCMERVNQTFELLLRHGDWDILSSEQLRRENSIQQRMERIMQYVQDSYNKKITIREIAKQEHLSESYTTHFVQKHLNMPFQTYVSLVRFEHAKQLLETTQLSPAEICHECGFSDRRYLNKVFLAETGMLPKEYRQNRCSWSGKHATEQRLSSERIYSDAEALAYLQNLQEWKGITDAN